MRALAFLELALACAAAAGCGFLVGRACLGRVLDACERTRKLSLDDVARDPVLSFAFFAALAFVLAAAVSFSLLPVLLLAAFVLSRRLPSMLAKRRARELREACDAQAPVLGDIVGMGVRAGLSFDAALGLYCRKFDCALAEQMRQALVSWQGGIASRERALSDTAARTGSAALRRFNDTALQAITYGSPLADMLVRFSADLRVEQHARLEQRVEKAPVKMLVPTGVCILPAMLILVTGPVVIQFAGSGF